MLFSRSGSSPGVRSFLDHAFTRLNASCSLSAVEISTSLSGPGMLSYQRDSIHSPQCFSTAKRDIVLQKENTASRSAQNQHKASNYGTRVVRANFSVACSFPQNVRLIAGYSSIVLLSLKGQLSIVRVVIDQEAIIVLKIDRCLSMLSISFLANVRSRKTAFVCFCLHEKNNYMQKLCMYKRHAKSMLLRLILTTEKFITNLN